MALRLALFRGPLTFVGGALPLIRFALAFVREPFALVRDSFALVRQLLAPVDGRLPVSQAAAALLRRAAGLVVWFPVALNRAKPLSASPDTIGELSQRYR